MRKVIAMAIAIAALSGCVPVTEHASVQFSVAPTPIVRVGETKTLARRINLRQPILVGVDDGLVTVTFAERRSSGVVLALDPASLEERSQRPFVYGATAAPTSRQQSSVALAGNRHLTCHCGEDGVLVRVDGQPQIFSDSAVGSALAATVDGRHVVVVYVVGTETGFELVAVSLDTGVTA